MKTKVRNTKPISIKNMHLSVIPIIFVMAVIPLLLRLHTYDTNYGAFAWFPEADQAVDIYLYIKAIAIISVGVIMLCLAIGRLVLDGKEIKFTRLFLPLFAYAILTILSSVLSEYSYFSYHGAYEQFESMWVVLGYIVIAYYTFLFLNTEKNVKIAMIGWMIGCGILIVIGISQILGHDITLMTSVKKLFVPREFWDSLDNLKSTFESGRVYLTLYNPNYVGSYIPLIFPVLLILLIFYKNKKAKICYLVLLLGSLACLLGSQSRTGILALAASLFLMVVLFYKQLIRFWKPALICLLVLLAGSFTFDMLNDNIISGRLKTLFASTETSYPLEKVLTSKDDVKITYLGNTLSVKYSMEGTDLKLDLKDDSDNPITTSYNETTKTTTITDSRFPGFKVTPKQIEEYSGIDIEIDKKTWFFTNELGDYYSYLNHNMKFVKIPEVELFKPLAQNNSFSNRSPIWARTIPLLKDYIILGSGQDTFTLVYPQTDYVTKVNTNSLGTIDVKPHNMYLQIWVHTGLLSLIAFLLFYIFYFVQCFRIYLHSKLDSWLSMAGVGIFLGTFGYMIAGTANDSTVTVAPVFWALMGMGLAINYQLKKQEQPTV